MKVVGREMVLIVACVIPASLMVVPTASARVAEGASRMHHRHHARYGHHHVERERLERVGDGATISGPLPAGLLGIGIAGATDGYGYGGYQRRAPIPPGYGYEGPGYHGPSYSYTGY